MPQVFLRASDIPKRTDKLTRQCRNLSKFFPSFYCLFLFLFFFLEYHFVCDDYSWLFVFWGASKLYGILQLVRLFTFYLKYHLAEVQRTWGQATIQGGHYNVHLIYLKRLLVSFTLFRMNMRKHPLHLNEATILWGACFRGASFETSQLWIAKKATSKMFYSIFFLSLQNCYQDKKKVTHVMLVRPT